MQQAYNMAGGMYGGGPAPAPAQPAPAPAPAPTQPGGALGSFDQPGSFMSLLNDDGPPPATGGADAARAGSLPSGGAGGGGGGAPAGMTPEQVFNTYWDGIAELSRAYLHEVLAFLKQLQAQTRARAAAGAPVEERTQRYIQRLTHVARMLAQRRPAGFEPVSEKLFKALQGLREQIPGYVQQWRAHRERLSQQQRAAAAAAADEATSRAGGGGGDGGAGALNAPSPAAASPGGAAFAAPAPAGEMTPPPGALLRPDAAGAAAALAGRAAASADLMPPPMARTATADAPAAAPPPAPGAAAARQRRQRLLAAAPPERLRAAGARAAAAAEAGWALGPAPPLAAFGLAPAAAPPSDGAPALIRPDSVAFCPAAAAGGEPAGPAADSGADTTGSAAAAAGRKRKRLEELEAECARASVGGRAALKVLPGGPANGGESGASDATLVECDAGGSSGSGGVAAAAAEEAPWKRLRLLVPGGYPAEPPLAVFDHGLAGTPSSGGASGGGAPAAAAGAGAATLRAREAWHEFQAAVREAPARDLAGLAGLWAAAVARVEAAAGGGACAA
jgi:hypothetical protein